MHRISILTAVLLALPCLPLSGADTAEAWRTAEERGRTHAECGRFAQQLLRGWLEIKQDPETHLFSRDTVWDYHNEAADHYSSLVLMASYVEPKHIAAGGALHATLGSMARLCATPSGLPVLYDLRTHTRGRAASFPELAEWLRDGLLRINEILGTETDWYRETLRLVDAILAEAPSQGGLQVALKNNEARGNMVQTLARLYVMSGRVAYLEAAEALADVVLLSGKPFTEELLTFTDHGCELVPGLAELFAVERQLGRPKGTAYLEPMKELLDTLMARGAHPVTGLFMDPPPASGANRDRPLPPDTWASVLFAYENYERATGDTRYRKQVEKPLRWLFEHRSQYNELASSLWPQSKSSDDWSDSYEGLIVLWNRYSHVGDGFAWLDWATRQHIHRRADHPTYGPFTAGHFDGSVGRTLCAHMMLCSQGTRAVPFTPGVELGAIKMGTDLFLTLKSEQRWSGRLVFDGTRTRHAAGTLDWARINETLQWFVAQPDRRYSVSIDDGTTTITSGAELAKGLAISTGPKKITKIRVQLLAPDASR